MADGFLGSGDIYINRKIDGVYQGYLLAGNSQAFKIKENSEEKVRESKSRANHGSALNTVNIKKPAEVELTLDDFDKENLSMIFLGDSSVETITGASVTDEAHTAYGGKIISTIFRNISAISVTHLSGTPTYVLDTDYRIIDAEEGLIEIIDGGGITDAEVIHIDYTYASGSSDKVLGGTNASIIAKILFLGINLANQKKVRANVFEAVLTPTEGVDFLADEFSTIPLTGKATVPVGGTEAYQVRLNVT